MFGRLYGIITSHFRDRTVPTVLPFPPPYKAMLAINSDVEWTSWENQLHLLEELAARNLETSFSFWMYSSPKRTWRLFEDDGSPTAYFEAASILGRAGLLDTIHSIGGRKHLGGCKFDRKAIADGYQAMATQNWRPSIYTNHGSTEDRQNVAGASWANYQEGDKPGSDLYHLDLSIAHGARFFWCDPDYTSEHTMLLPKIDSPDGIFVSDTGRDGRAFIRFRRWLGNGLPYGPSLDNLNNQLSQVLDEPNSGYSVIYQHLGVERLANGRPAPSKMPPLRKDAADCLDRLAKAHRSGEILVTTTARLLMHAALMTAKPWTIVRQQNTLAVQFDSQMTLGDVTINIEPKDLQGWSMILPTDTTVEAQMGGRSVDLALAEFGDLNVACIEWQSIDMQKEISAAKSAV